MLHRIVLIGALVGSVAWTAEAKQNEPPPAAPGTSQAEPPARAPGARDEGVIDPKADAALHRMSDYLSGLKSFRVDTTTVDELVSTEGQKVQAVQESKVTVRRPNQMRVDRVGPNGHAVLRYDGKTASVHNSDKNVYAQAPAPPALEAAIDDLRDRLHLDAPGGDLLVNNPYGALIEGVQVGRYVGLEPIGGVMAHHLAITAGDVDWQIWIQDGPQPLPLRYVITTKGMPGQPQHTIELRNWQPNASIPDGTFAFTPPAGARQVELTAPGQTDR